MRFRPVCTLKLKVAYFVVIISLKIYKETFNCYYVKVCATRPPIVDVIFWINYPLLLY